MHCPNCRHILTKVELHGIEIEHCNSCGGSLFEANEINRIDVKDAERLSMMKQTDVISATEKLSPRDGSSFSRFESPSIPQHVTLLRSESTGEIFAFPDDLVEFKKAQTAKVTYFKTWRIPMPAIRNVLVFSLVLFASATAAYMVNSLQSPTQQTIHAGSLCENNVGKIELKNGTLVSCTTPVDLSCQVEAECISGDKLNLTCTGNTYFTTVPESCDQVRFFYEDSNERVETDWVQTRD